MANMLKERGRAVPAQVRGPHSTCRPDVPVRLATGPQGPVASAFLSVFSTTSRWQRAIACSSGEPERRNDRAPWVLINRQQQEATER